MVDYRLRGADYANVTLLDSPFKRQRDETIETYLDQPATEDILKPFRDRAGIPTDARGMTGWGPSIGQYMGAYAKLYRGTGDRRLYDKCMDVFRGWAECVDASDAVMDVGTYNYEKTLGGLLDMYEYMGVEAVRPYVLKLTRYAAGRFDAGIPRDGLQTDAMKGQIEWYTLPENLLRAYQLFGDSLYRDFAMTWLYPYVWDKLAAGEENIGPRHAYSHVNSLSSAARTYIVTGDEHYLDVIRQGYESITARHTYATGGYGPAEMLWGEDPGYLGNALISTWDNYYQDGKGIVYKNFAGGQVARSDAWGSCEVSCCSWAVFKLCNYLLKLTGDAHYGEWAERLLLNGTLAQPPITRKGQVLYYASYFVDGAIKTYHDRRLQHLGQNFVWQCCTGTFPQDVAEYANMICYFDDEGPLVSQFVPARMTFRHDGVQVTLTSDADFPRRHRAAFTVEAERPVTFDLRVRVPAWATGRNTLTINGLPERAETVPGAWLTIKRLWQPGDRVALDLEYLLRFSQVDERHPNIVALLYGPLVLTCDEMTVLVGDREHPADWIKPVPGEENVFETLPGHSGVYSFVTRRFRPFYQVGLMEWYYMYNRIYADMADLDQHHQGF